jgi:hypothetical protein
MRVKKQLCLFHAKRKITGITNTRQAEEPIIWFRFVASFFFFFSIRALKRDTVWRTEKKKEKLTEAIIINR